MLIEIEHLSKTYESGAVGLLDVSLHIRDGIFGLLGPNGAGKTTLMRILATLLDPTSGKASVDGYDVRRQRPEIRAILGYLPQSAGFYPQLTVQEYLEYIGVLYGMNARDRRRALEESLEQVNLEEVRSRRVGHLSGGMRQRLGIAQAILSRPKLIIVDEPTAGLDPEERIRIRNLLTEIAGDRVIILSTHIVADVAESAKDLALLRRGRVVFHGSPSALIQDVEGKVWWAGVPADHVRALGRKIPVTALERTGNGLRARVLCSNPIVDLPGIPCEPSPANLEDAYIWTMEHVPFPREGKPGKSSDIAESARSDTSDFSQFSANGACEQSGQLR
jgi:ABC-type multidrug transport system ATPase subunit